MTIRFRPIILFAAIAITALTVACGGGSDDPDPTATSRPAPTATAVPATATTPPSTAVGDATRGEASFSAETCSACHSTGSNPIVGPGLAGVSERAAALGGDSYLEESIREPNAVVATGFTAGVMTSFSHLDDQTVADLVAYLKTLN